MHQAAHKTKGNHASTGIPHRPAPSTLVYTPAWWVAGAHAQTLWSRLFRRFPLVCTETLRWDTPDGDLLEIHRLPASPRAPRLLLLHGLEGSRRSHYARGLFALAQRRGWGMDLLTFRGCGETPNRARRFYHSGETQDIDFALRKVIDEFPGAPIGLAGVSLGGNVLLKYLGERGASVASAVRGAVTISVPYDLEAGARHLTKGFARTYDRHFLTSLRRKALAKLEVYPDLFSRDALVQARSIFDFDDSVTAPVHGFASAVDYYARSSALRFLEGIRVPTLLLSAYDDPFLPAEALTRTAEVARDNPWLATEFVERGGHVGFVGGRVPWRPLYYAEFRAMESLAESLQHERS